MLHLLLLLNALPGLIIASAKIYACSPIEQLPSASAKRTMLVMLPNKKPIAAV